MNTRLILSILFFASACIDADIRLKLCDATLSDKHTCDPIFQAGNTNAGQCCWETQYCGEDAAGNAKCMLKKPANSKKEGEKCTINFQGSANQNDDCDSNLVCLTVDKFGGINRCMRLCASSLGCDGGVRCQERPGYTVKEPLITKKVCDPKQHIECGTTAACCNPLDMKSESIGSCSDEQVCRLVVDSRSTAPLNSFTTCDYSKGTLKTGAACLGDWECMESHVCFGNQCMQVCVPGSTEVGLSCLNPNAICEKFGEQFGYCTY
jgi:hypothetical protein